MDWGIVVSVMVAMALFMVAVGILVLMVIGLFVWRMKKHAGSQGGRGFKFPGCPLMKSAQNTQ
jgi:heme/copper-type cytochrome/quinol oxidase subunit 2